jgi:predicted dehydrogenase
VTRTRYAVVGTGGRALMFTDAIAGPYAAWNELVALVDPSPTRMRFHTDRLRDVHGVVDVPTYAAEDFDAMVERERPDRVIVTTTDGVHHHYVIRAMELGCDVICEKPLTTTAEHARAIAEAVARTGRELRVTFNYRYAAAYTRVRELIAAGAVGRPTLVDLAWLLDTSHGADYFRRWHREREHSGGLLVHKASHHFDLVNWWIGARPTHVAAFGGLRFYGRDNAAERGESYDYDRYTDEPGAETDPFAFSLRQHPALTALYLDAEGDDGYVRDRNVFGEGVTIEDTAGLIARYDSGAVLSYSLVAYAPWEGLRLSITGDRGRIELEDRHGSHVIRGQSIEELALEQAGGQQSLWHYPMFGTPREVEIPAVTGSHGGGDELLLEDLFGADPPADPLGRAATLGDGVSALAVGLAANASIATAEVVEVAALLGPAAADLR